MKAPESTNQFSARQALPPGGTLAFLISVLWTTHHQAISGQNCWVHLISLVLSPTSCICQSSGMTKNTAPARLHDGDGWLWQITGHPKVPDLAESQERCFGWFNPAFLEGFDQSFGSSHNRFALRTAYFPGSIIYGNPCNFSCCTIRTIYDLFALSMGISPFVL